MFKPGMVVVTWGNKGSIISWLIRLATGNWWTHCFIVVNETESIEAKFPRVTVFKTEDRITQLKNQKRPYIVLDYPLLTHDDRLQISESALAYEGRLYDIWNCIFYIVFKSWFEGGRRVVCSRLMSAAFYNGVGIKLFTKFPDDMVHKHKDNLEDGYCTPDDLLLHSDLHPISYNSNS